MDQQTEKEIACKKQQDSDKRGNIELMSAIYGTCKWNGILGQVIVKTKMKFIFHSCIGANYHSFFCCHCLGVRVFSSVCPSA